MTNPLTTVVAVLTWELSAHGVCWIEIYFQGAGFLRKLKATTSGQVFWLNFQICVFSGANNAGCSLNCLYMMPQIYLSLSEDVNPKQLAIFIVL